MQSNLISASTKYTDLLGTAAADRADPNTRQTFKDIFEESGLEYDKYFPVAYSFNMPEEHWANGWNESDPFFVLIAHCVRKDEVGSTSQEVREYVDKNGELPTYRFSIETTAGEFFQLFKRLQIMFPSREGGTSHSALGNVTPIPQDYYTLSRD